VLLFTVVMKASHGNFMLALHCFLLLCHLSQCFSCHFLACIWLATKANIECCGFLQSIFTVNLLTVNLDPDKYEVPFGSNSYEY